MKLIGHKRKTVHTKPWLTERFGDCVAQISVDTKLKLKNSSLDVCRVHFGSVPPEASELISEFAVPPQGISDHDFVYGYESAEGMQEGAIYTDPALKKFVALYPEVWKGVDKLLGLPRQKGRHASAFVICVKPVSSFIPMMTVGGQRVTQYTKDSVEEAGAIKMDFLTVNALNDIQDCLKEVRRTSGVVYPKEITINKRRVPCSRLLYKDGQFFDIWDLPEDQSVFRDICEGKTETVFQFSTPGAVKWLKHFDHWKNRAEGRKSLDSIMALSAFTALDRPGPLNAEVIDPETGTPHNMLVEFARRARGEAPIGSEPVFDEMLPETYGVLTFQEQLTKIYQTLMGCSGAEAEEFRGNISKKKMDKINKIYPKWIEVVGAKYTPERAKAIWQVIETWAAYGFNASHAVSYCFVSYACAYLKRHKQTEWWCSVLRNAKKQEMVAQEKNGRVTGGFWRYARLFAREPDLSVSGADFKIVDGKIVAPVRLVAGVGPEAAADLGKLEGTKTIEDLVRKMVAMQAANCVPLYPEGVEQIPANQLKDAKGRPMFKPGRLPLGRTTVYSLIIAGVMDTLFANAQGWQTRDMMFPVMPPVMKTAFDKIKYFEQVLSLATGKKPQKPDTKWLVTDKRTEFKIRKQILPITNMPLQDLYKDEIASNCYYSDLRDTHYAMPCSLKHFRAMGEMQHLGAETFLSTPAYVLFANEFQYNKKEKPKTAKKFMLDVEGDEIEAVLWPPSKEDTLYPRKAVDIQAGDIVLCIWSRRKADRPYELRDIVVIDKRIMEEKEDENGQEKTPKPVQPGLF